MKAALREVRPTLMLALPIAIGQVSQMLMGITDSAMIGRTGTVPLAASSFGGGVFGIFFIMGIGLLTPVSVFVSRSRGEARPAEAGEYLRHGVFLALVAGVLEVGAILGVSRFMGNFGQPPEVVAAVNPFFMLIGVSLVPVLVYLALRQFAEAMGRPWVSMVVMLAGVGLNAFLNWIFIYGHLGCPALGLTGSGISTLISRSLGAVVIYLWLRFDPSMREAWPRHWMAPVSWERLRRMLALGIPTSGSLLFESGAFAAATIMMGWLGALPLAAHQIAISCVALTFMVALGLSMAVGVRVSTAIGAGERERLVPIWLSGLGLGVIFSSSLTLVFLFLGGPISHLFIHDAAVIRVATLLLVIAAVFQIFDGAQVVNSAALRGLTDVKVPALITFVAYWVIALPLGYTLGIRSSLGPSGIWIGLAAGLAAAAVMLGLRYHRMARKGVHAG
jgi:multidrug resistance protein, MATE family